MLSVFALFGRAGRGFMMNGVPTQVGGQYGAFALAVHWALSLVTWVLIIAVLVAILRWLWKKGGK